MPHETPEITLWQMEVRNNEQDNFINNKKTYEWL